MNRRNFITKTAQAGPALSILPAILIVCFMGLSVYIKKKPSKKLNLV